MIRKKDTKEMRVIFCSLFLAAVLGRQSTCGSSDVKENKLAQRILGKTTSDLLASEFHVSKKRGANPSCSM